MRMALIDHYDSFSFNVLDWLARGAVEVSVVPCDDAKAMTALIEQPVPLVLSPGPRRPEDTPATLGLVRALLGRVPILGVCLGHQMLAHLAGAEIIRGAAPFHGSTRLISPAPPAALAAPERRLSLMAGLAPFRAAVYNSLVVAPATLPPPWRVTATCERGEVAAIERLIPGEAPAYGVQFHPESFLSEGGEALREAWLQRSAIAPLSAPS